RNWKKRYFVLRGKTITYYGEDDLESAKPLGVIELSEVSGILEEGGSREHSFGLVTPSRTYHLTADTDVDRREWVEFIRRVRGMPEEKVKSLLTHEVDPRNAEGTIDLDSIDSVTAADQEKRPNSFAVITVGRVFNLVAESPAAMHQWIGALSPKKYTLGDIDILTSCQHKGWLVKEGKIRRRRFFVLTETNQIQYFRTEDTRQPVAGSIPLNCLCAVDLYDDDEVKETGLYTFRLHSRKTTYYLTAKTADEAQEWIVSIQYVFCQLVKQTFIINEAEVDKPGVLSCWQTLACMCCTFVPERAIKRYLTMHLKKTIERFPDTEMGRFATFCDMNLSRTRKRDVVPSRDEIIACLGRRDLKAVVYCYGGGACNIELNTATTAGEVVKKLSLGLQIGSGNNRFALFEEYAGNFRVIDDRVVLADVLAKFEIEMKEIMKKGQNMLDKKRLFFKIFCYIHPERIMYDSIEATFMFEQLADDIAMNRLPLSHEVMLKLGALRMQVLDGDHETGSFLKDIDEVYPLPVITARARSHQDQLVSGDLHETYYQKTLKAKNIGTLSKKFKLPEIGDKERAEAAVQVEMQKIRVDTTEYWKRLRGVSTSMAQQKYLEMIMEAPAFGFSFFEVEYNTPDQRFPKNLLFGVGARGVSFYRNGESSPMKFYPYEIITSFGAPVQNVYLLVVEAQNPISIETNEVVEIAKLMKAYISSISV
uniref:PH domain-containing protein n=1 Tax=Amphimedon queenslandica TaxID=400682 RepID=A0A1X7T799_AMPQE